MFNASNRGFQVTFPNGWTASIMFGSRNYCSNQYGADTGQSQSAEFWSWNGTDHYPENGPLGFQKPEDVTEFLAKVSSL